MGSATSATVDAPFATRRIEGGDGVGLHAEEWGNPDAQALLFVHGWSQSQLCWSRQVTGALTHDFHLVTFDNRGHGMSDKPAAPEAYSDSRLWAQDLAAVIDQTGLDRPLVVAWSYGGFIVNDYVRWHGESRIAGVNLVGAAVLLKPPTYDFLGPGLLANAEGMSGADLATNIKSLQRFLRACTVQPLPVEDWNSALCWNMAVAPGVRGAMIAREIDGSDVLAQLTIPVLVSHGDADQIVLPAMAEHVLASCPPAEASWYDGVGHCPFLEDAIRFDRELAAFADRVSRRPAR